MAKSFLQSISYVKDAISNSTGEASELQNLIDKINIYESSFNSIVQLNNEKERLINQDFSNMYIELSQYIAEFKDLAQKILYRL